MVFRSAIIIAGGKGTRLQEHPDDPPKPMTLVKGVPIIERVITWLRDQGVKNIILGVAYKKEKIMDYLKDGSRLGVKITYTFHDENGGTEDGFKQAIEQSRIYEYEENFYALYADQMTDLQLQGLANVHLRNNSIATVVTIKLKSKLGLIEKDKFNRITEIHESWEVPNVMVNSGIFVFNRAIRDYMEGGKNMVEESSFRKLIQKKKLYSFYYDGIWLTVNDKKELKTAENFLRDFDFARSRGKIIEECGICESKNLIPILFLGDQYVSNFVEKEEEQGAKVPLELVLCEECKLLQLRYLAPYDSMWNEKYWYKAGISSTIGKDLRDVVEKTSKMVELREGDIVVDIGSNDGTMLEFFDKKLNIVGFEPSKNMADEAKSKGFKVINNFFNAEDFKKEFGERKAKVVTIIATFYEIPYPNKFLQDLVSITDKETLIVIQQIYAPALLTQNAFDNIVHEHIKYYSFNSLRKLLGKYGMEVFDIESNYISGGSMRTYIRFKESEKLKPSSGAEQRIKDIIESEEKMELHTTKPYHEFAERANKIKDHFLKFLKEEKAKGKSIWIYGASTRGNAALQYFGVTNELITAIADRNVSKIGKMPAGTFIPITTPEEMRKAQPDYLWVTTWNYFDEIKIQEREYLEKGGKMITTMPYFMVASKDETYIKRFDNHVEPKTLEKAAPGAIERCRACDSKNLMPIISLGNQYITNFIGTIEEQKKIPKVPLELILCENCKVLQLRHNAPPESMWDEQYWYKSAISTTIKKDLGDIVEKSQKIAELKEEDVAVDIGSNDGTLLSFYKKGKLVGFEPSKNVAREAESKGFEVINNFFNAEDFKKEFGERKAKIITAISMFYDLEDPNKFLRDILSVLDKNGLFVIQQNYLATMLKYNAFDNICHEHREYYSFVALKSLLEKHGLEVFDIETNDINGGSIRTYIRLKGNQNLKPFEGAENRIKDIIESEEKMELHTTKPYLEFAARIDGIKKSLMDFLVQEKAKGKRIWVYGASTRGNVILQYFGLNERIIDSIADKNNEKHGKRTVGSFIPITTPEEMRKAQPDYLLVNTWHFFDEIKEQEKEYFEKGGILLTALPNLRIVKKN